jgi:peptidoglycan/LPS O-acetylase OafA/YrhL
VAVWCWSYLAIYQNTFLRMDSFMCGALLAWAADRAGGAVPAPPRWTGWAVAAGAVVLAALPQVSRRDVPTTLAGYVLLDAVAAGAVWMCLTPSSTLHRLLRREPFRWLGSISYGLYVYHALALAIVLAALGPGVQATLSWPARAAAAASALAIAVALATLSYYAYERWFLRLKTLFSPRRPAAGAATPPLA